MLGQIDRFVRQQWPAWNLGPADGAQQVRYALLPGGGVNGKLTYLCWTRGAAQPALVIKLARTPCANPVVAAENTALAAIRPYLPAGPHRVPHPLACAELEGLQVAAETALPGRPLQAYLAEHRLSLGAALHRLAPPLAWLQALHARSARPAGAAELQHAVLEPLAGAQADLAGSSAERDVLARLHAQALALADSAALPLVFNHNDAGPPNILVDKRGAFAGLIDWESGAWGLPAADPLYMLARVADTTMESGFQALFFHDGPAARLVRQWLGAYCGRLGLAPAWLPVLFALTWIRHVRNEQHQQHARLARTPRLAQLPLAPTRDAPLLPFRGQLRFYLEHLESCLISRVAAEAP